MNVECPSCGCRFQVKNGRPKSEINVQKVIVRLREDLSVEKTAKNLKCSKSTIYSKLRNIGIDPKTITGHTYTKKEKIIEN